MLASASSSRCVYGRQVVAFVIVFVLTSAYVLVSSSRLVLRDAPGAIFLCSDLCFTPLFARFFSARFCTTNVGGVSLACPLVAFSLAVRVFPAYLTARGLWFPASGFGSPITQVIRIRLYVQIGGAIESAVALEVEVYMANILIHQ